MCCGKDSNEKKNLLLQTMFPNVHYNTTKDYYNRNEFEEWINVVLDEIKTKVYKVRRSTNDEHVKAIILIDQYFSNYFKKILRNKEQYISEFLDFVVLPRKITEFLQPLESFFNSMVIELLTKNQQLLTDNKRSFVDNYNMLLSYTSLLNEEYIRKLFKLFMDKIMSKETILDYIRYESRATEVQIAIENPHKHRHRQVEARTTFNLKGIDKHLIPMIKQILKSYEFRTKRTLREQIRYFCNNFDMLVPLVFNELFIEN